MKKLETRHKCNHCDHDYFHSSRRRLTNELARVRIVAWSVVGTMLLLALATLLMTIQTVKSGEGIVIANGCVYCNGSPLRNITVKMFDVDTLVDTLMDKTATDRNGCFHVNGSASDLQSEIDPIINFYHKCPMSMDYGRCLLKSRLVLDAPMVVNVGSVNLTETEVSSLETTKDCIN